MVFYFPTQLTHSTARRIRYIQIHVIKELNGVYGVRGKLSCSRAWEASIPTLGIEPRTFGLGVKHPNQPQHYLVPSVDGRIHGKLGTQSPRESSCNPMYYLGIER